MKMEPDRRSYQEIAVQTKPRTSTSPPDNSSATHNQTPKEVQNEKKCFIKVVLPTQGDGSTSNLSGRVSILDSSKTESSSHSLPGTPANSPTTDDQGFSSADETAEEVVQENVLDNGTDHQNLKRAILDSCRDNHQSLDAAILDSYTTRIGSQKHIENAVLPLVVGNAKLRYQPNVIQKLYKRTEKKTCSKVDRSQTRKTDGSFVDIGGWQDDLQKTDPLLRKRRTDFPSLSNRYRPMVGERRFQFEHQEDLNNYIRDYRYMHTLGNVGRKQFLNGARQSMNHVNSFTVPHRNSNYRVKTTDPATRTFLPQTGRKLGDVHPGCILCEKEKFQLRNSFPKRVYLSWNQYLALCKSNTFMMSQATNYAIDTEPRQSTPRAVTSYSPTRPLLLLNQRDKSYEMGCKYGSELNNSRTESNLTEKKKSYEIHSPVVDKTLLVYRMRGKHKKSGYGGKSELSDISHSGVRNSVT